MNLYWMACVIPLAQAADRKLSAVPPADSGLPGAALPGTERHWEMKTTALQAVIDRSGLFCGKCATQIHKWTRILVQ